MNELVVVIADLTAICVLVFGIYFPRHHRRDLVTAFLGVNIGVLAVSMVLGSTAIGAGLGLGLFGVLSIIRLRSDEIAQHEVAYYFASLALGLLSGLSPRITGLSAGLMALMVATLYLGDHPRLYRRYQFQLLRLDAAYLEPAAVQARLANLVAGRIVNVSIKQVDLVNDSTLVEVRYVCETPRPATVPAAPAPGVRQMNQVQPGVQPGSRPHIYPGNPASAETTASFRQVEPSSDSLGSWK